MNRPELLRLALQDQRHQALETPVAELDALPTDLLQALVDFRSATDYQLLGFLVAPKSETLCFLAGTGALVIDDRVATLSGAQHITVTIPETGVQRTVARSALHWVDIPLDWWFALVEGNGVILAKDLREAGFPCACATSPTLVAVYPV